MSRIRTLDLFSGVGGIALGLEQTGGFETVAFCEANPFRRAILRKHWPGVRIYDDVQTVPFLHGIDAIVGGPPCHGTSVAAAIQGKRDGRTLWPQMFAIVQRHRERCQLVVVEQPPGNAEWEAAVTTDLEGVGYHVTRLKRSARACGAPHLRRRVFIIAHADRERCKAMAQHGEKICSEFHAWPPPPRGAWRSARTGNSRVDHGVSDWVDRIAALGDSVSPPVVADLGRMILESMQ